MDDSWKRNLARHFRQEDKVRLVVEEARYEGRKEYKIVDDSMVAVGDGGGSSKVQWHGFGYISRIEEPAGFIRTTDNAEIYFNRGTLYPERPDKGDRVADVLKKGDFVRFIADPIKAYPSWRAVSVEPHDPGAGYSRCNNASLHKKAPWVLCCSQDMEHVAGCLFHEGRFFSPYPRTSVIKGLKDISALRWENQACFRDIRAAGTGVLCVKPEPSTSQVDAPPAEPPEPEIKKSRRSTESVDSHADHLTVSSASIRSEPSTSRSPQKAVPKDGLCDLTITFRPNNSPAAPPAPKRQKTSDAKITKKPEKKGSKTESKDKRVPRQTSRTTKEREARREKIKIVAKVEKCEKESRTSPGTSSSPSSTGSSSSSKTSTSSPTKTTCSISVKAETVGSPDHSPRSVQRPAATMKNDFSRPPDDSASPPNNPDIAPSRDPDEHKSSQQSLQLLKMSLDPNSDEILDYNEGSSTCSEDDPPHIPIAERVENSTPVENSTEDATSTGRSSHLACEPETETARDDAVSPTCPNELLSLNGVSDPLERVPKVESDLEASLEPGELPLSDAEFDAIDAEALDVTLSDVDMDDLKCDDGIDGVYGDL